jgi:hypothetical protein
MLPFNAGGWLIEVTVWADLTVFDLERKDFKFLKVDRMCFEVFTILLEKNQMQLNN